MNGHNINQEPADALDIARGVNQYINFKAQPTIPAKIANRLVDVQAKRLQNAMYSFKPNTVSDEDENPHTLGADMNIIEGRHGRVRRMGVVASGRIDGIKARQRQIAEQIASTAVYSTEHARGRSAPTAAPASAVPLEKINQRLTDLEQISKDINQNIAHIDAVVAIKDNYLRQLKTAKELLAIYKAAQASGDEDKLDEAEIFHAAYTVIMHNVQRRYNPNALNANGHETIVQVIARLEHEVADLNAKAAEERFEVKMEETLLSSLVNAKNIKQVEYMLSHNQAMEFESLCDVILKTIIDTRMKTFPWSEMEKSENGLADIERMQQIKRNVIQRLISSLDIPRKTGDKGPDPIVVGLDSVVLDWNAKIDEGSPKEKQEPLNQNTKTVTSKTPSSIQEETYIFDYKNFKL